MDSITIPENIRKTLLSEWNNNKNNRKTIILLRRYVHSAIKVFTLEHEADDMNHKIYAAVANMYGKFGITPEDLHKVNNSEHHGFQEGHVGTTIKHFTETIENQYLLTHSEKMLHSKI